MIPTRWCGRSECYRYSTTGDLPDFLAMLADPEVGRWLWFTPAPAAMFVSYFRPLLEQQHRQLAAGERPRTAVFTVEDTVEDTDRHFLGQGAVLAIDGSPGGFEIGFQLPRAAWRRGIGSRLAEFLCAYAIRCNGAFRIEANCLDGNAGSRAILTGLGLVQEGTRPGYRLRDGVRHTEWLFGAEVRGLDAARFGRVADEVGLAQ